MRYLLDTHVLLWFLTENLAKLSPTCQKILLDESNHLYFSKASIWEIAIKHSLGKPDFECNPQEIGQELLRLGFLCLDIELSHLYGVVDLPMIHKDPFDRLLIIQAESENLQLLTADKAILQYNQAFILDAQSL